MARFILGGHGGAEELHLKLKFLQPRQEALEHTTDH